MFVQLNLFAFAISICYQRTNTQDIHSRAILHTELLSFAQKGIIWGTDRRCAIVITKQ